MLAQAAGLAVLAAVSPTALVVCAVLLGSPSPKRTGVIYLVGAVTVTAVTTAVLFVVLRAGHLDWPQQHVARDSLRLGLGILMLAAGIVVLLLKRRRDSRVDRDGQQSGYIGRLLSRPGARTAFLLGSILYAPSLPLVAAVQVVATSHIGIVASVLVLVIVIVITVVAVWVPLLCYLIWPEQTVPILAGFNGWLRTNGPVLLAVALVVGGLYLTINGASGLG